MKAVLIQNVHSGLGRRKEAKLVNLKATNQLVCTLWDEDLYWHYQLFQCTSSLWYPSLTQPLNRIIYTLTYKYKQNKNFACNSRNIDQARSVFFSFFCFLKHLLNRLSSNSYPLSFTIHLKVVFFFIWNPPPTKKNV